MCVITASQVSKNTGVSSLNLHRASLLSDTMGIGMGTERCLVCRPIMCLSGKAGEAPFPLVECFVEPETMTGVSGDTMEQRSGEGFSV